jgi:LmbE family N-acetylglucosaminyl deacetylase
MSRVLVVTAHPDDPEFQAGGTVARWTDEGIEVVYCVITDGDSGGADPSLSRAQRGALRRTEQLSAAKVLGVEDVRFLGYTDGTLDASLPLRRDLCGVVRQVRPTRMLIPSPEINWAWFPDFHPDHRAAGEAALCAAYPDARTPFAPDDVANSTDAPWLVPEVWIMSGPRPDTVVDVTESADRKISALREHASQTAHVEGWEERVRGRLAERARGGGLAEGCLAEAFQVVRVG